MLVRVAAIAAAAATAAACGDNAAGPIDAVVLDHLRADATVDAAPDAPVGPPDLRLVPDEMTGTVSIASAAFTPASCEILEACVGNVGLRRLLKFDAVAANDGPGDLVLGALPAPGQSDATFMWSACHGHHHVSGFATYELRDANGVVVSGHKQAFCVQDVEQLQAGAPSRGYDCVHQGMSVGWADVYSHTLPCQWIDITDVPAGTYTLRVVLDPGGALPDRDPTNNEWMIDVTI